MPMYVFVLKRKVTLLTLNYSNGDYPMSFLYVPPGDDVVTSGITAVVIGSTHEVDAIRFKAALDRKLSKLRDNGIDVKSKKVTTENFTVFPTQEELEARVRTEIDNHLSEFVA